jgi:glycosyltransferase involved in cell wall biosynthesis
LNTHVPAARPGQDSLRAAGRIAILIPCYNEEAAIGKVVRDFRAALPEAVVYVYDNNSTDRTRERARDAGAVLGQERRQGKGYVVRTMFREVEAEVYVLVDGDDTYSAREAGRLIAPIIEGHADMVVGTRLRDHGEEAFQPLRLLGNWVFTGLFNLLFEARLSDMLSGYRALSRNAVKSLSIQSGGFDIETELTILAVERGFRIVEVPLPYGKRPEGSASKLRTLPDGLRVLRRMVLGSRRGRRRAFAGGVALLAALAAAGAATVMLIQRFG